MDKKYQLDDMILTESQYEHSRMVSLISYRLAQEIWNDEEKALMVGEAARLHDIGKNFIPKEILNKPGKLTDEEFEIVKTHSHKGAEYLLRQIKVLMFAAIIALQHHEWVNGGGYNGITHTHEIAELVAVADVFDALISQRSYKGPWPLDEVVSHMRSGAGKHFNAIYVDALIQSLDDILSLYKHTKESDPAASA